MEKKQTAVDWLEEQVKDIFYVAEASEMTKKFKSVYEQAKQMEKQQIENSYLDGDSNGCGCYDWSTEKQAEDYYKETYLGIIKEEE
jgi:hypothetical protein